MTGMCEIAKAVHFEAAHYLAAGGEGDPRRRLHGHSFRLEVAISRDGEVPEQGGPDGSLPESIGPDSCWVKDFAVLAEAVEAVRLQLDHQLLNEIPGLETPTMERICAFVAGQLRATLPGLVRVSLSRPSLGESCTLTLPPKR